MGGRARSRVSTSHDAHTAANHWAVGIVPLLHTLVLGTDVITIKFKCSCTNEEQSMDVRERNETETAPQYMRHLQTRLGEWHKDRACLSTRVTYIKIPVPYEGRIGSKPETKH